MTAPTDNAALTTGQIEELARRAGREVAARNGGPRINGNIQSAAVAGARSALAALAALAAVAAAIPPEQDGYAEGRADYNGHVPNRYVPPLPAGASLFAVNPKTGAWHYANHAGTWQGMPNPIATDRHAEGRIAELEEAARRSVAALRSAQHALDLIARPSSTTRGLKQLAREESARVEDAIRTIANGGTAA